MKPLPRITTAVIGLTMLLSATTSAARTVTFEINVAERLQRLEGWGVSLCWWAGQCGRWDEAKLDTLLHWIADKDGLNYNVFRYNIPGGDDPENRHCDPHHMGRGKGLRAEMEGFKREAKGKYHWEADSAQRRVLLKLRRLRPDDLMVEAFSNTPPYYMTVSGCAAGHDEAGNDNLRPECRKDFCRYLVDVCKHYKKKYRLEFTSLEPFNEPQTSYWGRGGGQEGCHFDIATMMEVSRILSRMMKRARLKTRLSVTDETSVKQSIKAFDAFQAQPETMAAVGQWNTHTYEADSLSRVELSQRTKGAGIPLWMSETGAGGRGLEGNLRLSRRLMDDLKQLQPVVWCDWQVMEENNDQWCTVRGSFKEETFWRVKNYFVRMQVTRFIKQGYTLLHVDDANSIAALSPDGNELVLVSQNNSDYKVNFSVRLPFLKSKLKTSVKRYITDSRHNCDAIATARPDSEGILTYTLPRQSISTFVITAE